MTETKITDPELKQHEENSEARWNASRFHRILFMLILILIFIISFWNSNSSTSEIKQNQTAIAAHLGVDLPFPHTFPQKK